MDESWASALLEASRVRSGLARRGGDGAIDITAPSLSSSGRENWLEFLRSMVVLERRTGAKLANGLLNGPEVAVPEAGFPDPNGRRFRRVRKEGKEEPPDPCVESAWGECGGA